MMWMRRERRRHGRGTLAQGLTLSLAMSQALVFCSAAGMPLRSTGDGENIRGDQQLRQQEKQPLQHPDARETPCHVTASSAKDKPDPASAAPEQVHIAFASSGSLEEYAVTVAWSTWPKARSQVTWGSSQKQDNVANGNSTFYTARHPGRADYTSSFLHSATLEGLKPSSTYYYACGDTDLAMSSVRSFVTPPKIGPEHAITLGILGDLGQTEDSAATLAAIGNDASLDLVLHAGDLSYADCDQPRWDSFMRMLDPVASRIPWMVAAGNHEIETNGAYSDTKPFLAYEHRFRMPAAEAPAQLGYGCGTGGGLDGTGDVCGEGFGADEADAAATLAAAQLAGMRAGLGAGAGGPTGKAVGAAVRQTAREVREAFDAIGAGVEVRGGEGEEDAGEEEEPPSCCPSEWSGTYDYGNSFYSFDVGPVHVVVLNPYTASGENSEQFNWLQKDLESADRTLTPWLVAMMHCPWYNSNLAHQGERQTETAMRAVEPLLYQHKAAVVISGHVHAYERSYPVVDFQLTEDGPVHLVVGGAGNREGHAADYYPSPEWSAYRDGTLYGSGRLSIKSSSLALWEWTSSEEDIGVHDVAFISNPFSPYAPGKAEGDKAPVVEVTGGSGGGGDSGSVSAQGEGGGKARIGRTSGLRIPTLTTSRMRHFM
ncbi:unnamed protein product [Pylaiella littoralis]